MEVALMTVIKLCSQQASNLEILINATGSMYERNMEDQNKWCLVGTALNKVQLTVASSALVYDMSWK